MRVRLTPQDPVFYELFAAAAENLEEATATFAELLPSGADHRAVAGRIRELEHTGDEITHSVIRRLNSTLVPPFDRDDVYRLVGCLDDVLDFVEEAADLILLYGVESLPEQLQEMIRLLAEAGQLTARGLARLRSRRGLEEYWIGLAELEKRADLAYRQFISLLFSSGRDALTVMKLKEVGAAMESAADAFGHVANTVETIAVKEF